MKGAYKTSPAVDDGNQGCKGEVMLMQQINSGSWQLQPAYVLHDFKIVLVLRNSKALGAIPDRK